MHMTQRHGSA